ncbi:hypothetical protein DFJ43DRAFT_991653 [Lentinula guzmanii]|uniref:Uncharacterized protein n=1 Tax=Lentinula guzmanii TaxID=2804957 RepID=A0AA38JSI5_9AGAR|nr:hypothetical protein DFJ43DRAFT_991653 [Lentinula guzmanii]
MEKRVARSKQLHKCEIGRCLIIDPRTGNLRCKRRAPFQISNDDYINEDGEWGLKRSYKFMNGFVRPITVNVRCNNDGKLLTNGNETRNVSFYISKYQLKVQGRNFNTSAVFAKTLAYHRDHSDYVETLQERQRLFLFRVCHAMNREQELAAPMVMSYLMGWGDMYRSHHYIPIYWTSFVGRLLEAFPSLKRYVILFVRRVFANIY